MNADLGFSATVYGLGGGLFFLGYALFEVPVEPDVRPISARAAGWRGSWSPWGLLLGGV